MFEGFGHFIEKPKFWFGLEVSLDMDWNGYLKEPMNSVLGEWPVIGIKIYEEDYGGIGFEFQKS